jgi:peptide/nickel transport system substrate-binding protein
MLARTCQLYYYEISFHPHNNHSERKLFMKKILLLVLVLALAMFAGSAMAARSGGTLNYMAPYGGDLFGLDPHTSSRVQDYLVEMNIHRGLYKWSPSKSMPVLELAESVKASDDGMVYTYKLHPNIKFHNGRQLTADDVLYSFNRIMSMKPASPASRHIRIIKGATEVQDGKAETISGLKKVDDLTFEMTLENPVDPKYFLFWVSTAIVPKEEAEREDFSTNPVGCGPFKFGKWVKGSKIELVKNPEYFKAGKPYLDKVIINIMSESASRDLAFKAKDLDATIVGAVHYPEYKKDPVISKNMVEVAEMFTRHVGFNPNFKPFQNKKVRQAINYAIPTDLIIEKVLKGKAFSPRGWLPSSSPAFDPKGKKYEFNTEKAKQLMKEAGFEKGFTVEQCHGHRQQVLGRGHL